MATVTRFSKSANLYTLNEFDDYSLSNNNTATTAGNGGAGANGQGNTTSGTAATVGAGGGGGGGSATYYDPIPGGNGNGNSGGGGGGGVGVLGQGSNGTASANPQYATPPGGGGGSGGTNGGNGTAIFASAETGGGGGTYGGGGGSATGLGSQYFPTIRSGAGGGGAVRIIWGDGRSFPSTLTDDRSSPAGQQLYDTTGSSGSLGSSSAPSPVNNSYTYTFTAPAGITSVCAVAVGGGGSGAVAGTGASAGGGGGLGWRNYISVSPGNSYTVVVGGGGTSTISNYYPVPGNSGADSYFIDINTVKGGGGGNGKVSGASSGGTFYGQGGGNGGAGGIDTTTSRDAQGSGGGGAGGYAGVPAVTTGTARSITSTGTYKVTEEFDEVSMNPNAVGSILNPYHSVPYNSSHDLSSNDFTIECWIYNFRYRTETNPNNGAAGSTSLSIVLQNTAYKLYVDQVFNWLFFSAITSTGNYNIRSLQNSILAGEWYHIAVVRSGDNIYFYINGTKVTTANDGYGGIATLSGPILYSGGTSDLIIGGSVAYPLNLQTFNGYIGDLQIINGTALYTDATLTVPDIPFYKNLPNTALRLKPLAAEIVDEGPNQSVITPLTGAGTSSSFHPFRPNGYYSVKKTAYDYSERITATTTGIIDQRADFTLEFWLNITTAPTGVVYIFNTTSPYSPDMQINSYNILLNTNKTITVERWNSTTATTTVLTSGALSLTNNWYHIALVRIGSSTNNLKIYVDGTLNAQTTATNFCSALATSYSVFLKDTQTTSWTGYISNFRYTNNIGVYTGAFTVPGNPLKKTQTAGTNISAITSTSSVALLTFQSSRYLDNSSYKCAMTRPADSSDKAFIDSSFPPNFVDTTYNGMSTQDQNALTWEATGQTASKLTRSGKLVLGGIIDEVTGFQTGTIVFTSSQNWSIPYGVTRLNVCCVGAGAYGSFGNPQNGRGNPYDDSAIAGGNLGAGGGGGGLGWKNNIVVDPYTVPTATITVGVSAQPSGGSSSFVYNGTTHVLGGGGSGTSGGGYTGTGGGNGGAGGAAGSAWFVLNNNGSGGNNYYGGGGGGGGAGGYGGDGGYGGACGFGGGAGSGLSTYSGYAGGGGSGGGGGGGGGGVSGESVNENASSQNGARGGGVGVSGRGANGAGGNPCVRSYTTSFQYSGPTVGGNGSGGGYGYGGSGNSSGGSGAVCVRYNWQGATPYV